MKKLFTLLFALANFSAFAQLSPAVSCWVINSTGATGYGNIPSNVLQVQYSTNNVYVTCNCIPGYSIGPWGGNPNIPANQNFLFKITLNPQQNTGTPVNTPLGHIGVWSNGVTIFNPRDAMSYNNQNVWHQNAIVVEGPGFDNCLGHPNQTGEYHHHLNPTCLYNDADSSNHSPIIGYAFDGFPIYGAYSYTNTNGTGAIKRMASSYRLRNITVRDSLPGGVVASQPGPAVSGTYPLGYYVEDFECVSGLGDLDTHNGRFCVTPEYPSGTYAYFVTIDNQLNGAYPYVLGPAYYGTVQAGNTGMGSGHNTISETVQIYTSVNEIENKIEFEIFPNPLIDRLNLSVMPTHSGKMKAALYNNFGMLMQDFDNLESNILYSIDVSKFASGMYCLKIFSGDNVITSKVVISK